MVAFQFAVQRTPLIRRAPCDHGRFKLTFLQLFQLEERSVANQADSIDIGAGLTGLVAACDLADFNK